MSLVRHVVQVNVYTMLVNVNENDQLAMVDQEKLLRQKMYSQAK